MAHLVSYGGYGGPCGYYYDYYGQEPQNHYGNYFEVGNYISVDESSASEKYGGYQVSPYSATATDKYWIDYFTTGMWKRQYGRY